MPTSHFDGCLLDKRYLIHDRDYKSTEGFDHVIRCYLRHYHAERNHQGLDKQLIVPDAAVDRVNRPVNRCKRLGGMLSYSYREAT